MTTFSVLICTYNRHELLRAALDALIDKTVEKPDELIIVNAGDERADKVINDFAGRHGVHIQVAKATNNGPAANRNVGLGLCTGDIIAITDDDSQVNSDWVTQMKRSHREHPEAGAVGGMVIGVSSDKSFLSRLIDLSYFPSWQLSQHVTTLPTVNISYKRTALEQLGSFDEKLIMGEDVDYNWRLIKLGYKIFYDPSILVSHHNVINLLNYWRRQYNAGRYYYFVRRKWPELYSVYPRKLSRPKDLLKIFYFALSPIYEPILMAFQMTKWADRILAFPVLVITHLAWKGGMITEILRRRGN